MILTRTLPTAIKSSSKIHTATSFQYIRAMSSSSAERLVLSKRSPSDKVLILQLNRPKALNALSSPLFEQLNEELEKADKDDGVRAIVLTGSDRAFAAGADIKEMRDKDCSYLLGRAVLTISLCGLQEQFLGNMDQTCRIEETHHRCCFGLRRMSLLRAVLKE